MPSGLTVAAAWLLGLAASGHCAVMCGGISSALGMATARGKNGRPRAMLIAGYQVGRMLSYALAGLVLGGALGTIVGAIDLDVVRRALRVLSAIALGGAALVAFGRLPGFGGGLGRHVWPRLAPLGRRLLPVTSLPRALGFGMVWGWMPCGFAYTVLAIATLQLDAWRAAATMLAFGFGTAPAMFAAAFGAQELSRFTAQRAGRRVAGTMLVASAALTLTAPWIVAAVPALHPWMPFLCTIDAR